MFCHRSATRRSSAVIVISTLLVASFLLVLPGIPKSFAHAFIVKSDPSDGQTLYSPPSKVDVWFSDPIDIRYSQLKVLDSSGKQVDNKDVKNIQGDQTTLTVSLPPGLPNGIYTVSTKVLDATDGHVTEYAFVFGIGQVVTAGASAGSTSSAQLQIPEAAARFPALVGQVLIVGAAFAALWLWRPVSKIPWLREGLVQGRSKMDERMVKLMLIGSIILIASGFAMIVVQANSIGAGIGDAILTKFGNVWVVRMVQSAILLAISIGMYSRMRKRRGAGTAINQQLLPRTELAAMLVIGIAVLATTTLISHGASLGQPLPVALDFIHNIAAALWIGGIIYLAFVVVPELKRMVDSGAGSADYAASSALSILIPRFSIIVLTILGVIIVTGPFLLYTIEPNLDLTVSSLYGKALIAKLALAGIMAAIGGYNQRVIHRQALRGTFVTVGAEEHTLEGRNGRSGGGGGSSNNGGNGNLGKRNTKSVLSKFGRSTAIEAGLGIGLLVAVAVLVNTGTPASEFQKQLQQQQAISNQQNFTSLANQPFQETRFAENNSRIIMTISPFTPGNNNFTFSFLDQNRNPIDMKSVQIKYTQVEKNIGPITVDAKPSSMGVFTANAAFGLPGHWSLRVEGVPNRQNALNLIATYDDLFVKPKPSQLSINIQEFKMPDNQSLPLYPVYDSNRNVIWVGDSGLGGQLWEFNINSSKFIEHKIDGAGHVALSAIDSNGKVWFIDEVGRHLGVYDPNSGKSQLYPVPNNDVPSGIAVDNQNGTIWITSTLSNDIMKFDPQANNFTTTLKLPGSNAQPFSLAVDGSSGQIWVVDEAGKLANIDPANHYKVTEYGPPGNATLAIPSALLIDPDTGNIYISEHEGHAVDVFNPLLKTFNKIQLDPANESLPFGMAMDSSHFLWVAQHTLNKIAVVDPRTGEYKEADIPLGATQTQWLTSDSEGGIWLAEQRQAALGLATTTASLSPSGGSTGNSSQIANSGILKLGFSFADIVGPSVAAGIVGVAILFSKSMLNLNDSIRQVKRSGFSSDRSHSSR